MQPNEPDKIAVWFGFSNGLIQRYLPKKTSFEKLTQEELDNIVF